MAIAILNDYRQSPRKLRLLADLVRGKRADQAIIALNALTKRGSLPLRKLIESAIANSKHDKNSASHLVVKEITVNGGPILYRQMPRARGSAAPIRKRTSHCRVVLEEIKETQKTKA
ncbi:MAG: 50S ribosomal protein L22 [Patescibacteria group bacterium]